MNSNELIENYFSKNISKQELLEFNHLYDTNPEFKEEVDFLKAIKSVSEAEDDLEFKKQLTSYESEYIQQEKKKIAKWLKPLTAVAALLIIALSINFLINSSINEDKLFATYFEPSKNVSSPIVRSETDETSVKNAFIAYSEMNYIQAISLFDKAFDNTKNQELLFYEGNSLLALGKTEEAIETFKEHLTYDDALSNRTHWYLALAYLKMKQLDKAKVELKALMTSEETFKKTEAISLLEKLE
nr:tetratricopeptide repeat protein [uncultured Psychroserpens sp.]